MRLYYDYKFNAGMSLTFSQFVFNPIINGLYNSQLMDLNTFTENVFEDLYSSLDNTFNCEDSNRPKYIDKMITSLNSYPYKYTWRKLDRTLRFKSEV